MFAGFFLTFRRLSEVAGGYDVHCLIGLRHEHVRTVRGKGAGCLRLSSGCEGSQKHGFRVLLSHWGLESEATFAHAIPYEPVHEYY